MNEQLAMPLVLDACCGPRMMWFDPGDSRALFIDKRRETHPIDIGTPGTIGRAPIIVDPDILADFTALPFPDESFSLVVMDPPHIEREQAKGILTRKYGNLRGDWRYMLQVGFAECFRVLKASGTFIFKWAESDHPLSEILALTPEKPLFGHRSGNLTHWCVFMKAAPFQHPYGGHPHQTCACGAKVPTDVYLIHSCGDRLTPCSQHTSASQQEPK